MKIVIDHIPHKNQRYNTCGDWTFENGCLLITVSKELPENSAQLVALHEHAEAIMCLASGITQKQVDEFDMNYKGDGEPGDEKAAPYFMQHQTALAIEKLAALEMDVNWIDHGLAIEALP